MLTRIDNWQRERAVFIAREQRGIRRRMRRMHRQEGRRVWWARWGGTVELAGWAVGLLIIAVEAVMWMAAFEPYSSR